MNLAQLLARSARVFPQTPAVSLGKTPLYDYRGFANRASGLAHTFRSRLRLKPGERVALFMRNCPAYLEILYGAWMAGLAAVPVNSKLHPLELRFILEDSAAAMLFVTEDACADLQPLHSRVDTLRHIVAVDRGEYEAMLKAPQDTLVDRGPDDLAWLFYTSGTTGRPKGVMLTHRNLMAMTLAYFADVDRVERNDAMIYAAPLSHGAGLYSMVHMLSGARHVIPESGGFDPTEFFELSNHHRNAVAFAAPTMVKRLVEHAEAKDAASDGIKTIVYGGGPMYTEDIKRALRTMGQRFVQIYGQGESPMTIACLGREHLADRDHPRYEQRIASVGIAHSVVEVRVADATGQTLPAEATGEILVRGDPVMKGYWNNPAATESAIRDGWLWTGDMGSLDADGFLTLKDRSKDMIISGGSNIYPREIEEVLLQCPGVHEVAVVGRPHPEWGEEVVAMVVCRPGANVTEGVLEALCLSRIARFKRPREYCFIDALPKNNYGKVLKTALRERLRS